MNSDERESLRQGVAEFFRTFPYFNLMGFELVEIEPGRAKLAVNYRHDLCQPAGIMHGGVIASLVDTCIAHSILMTDEYVAAQAKGSGLVSVDLRIKYLRPVSKGRIVCESRVPRMGRHIIHADSVVTDEQGKEVARGDSIYMIISPTHIKR